MANPTDDSAFDLHGILHSAGNAHRRRKSSLRFQSGGRRSFSSRRRARPRITDEDGTVFELSRPSIKQHRKSQSAAHTKNFPVPTRSFWDGEVSDEKHAEQVVADEEFYEKLYQYNSKGVNGTIRLPSDFLHRRKSRFDVEDIPVDDAVAYDPLNFNSLAINTARRRAEEDAIQTTYKRVADFYKDTTFLRNTLNRIQGRFGAAIMEYFSFVKWLVLLNIFITLMTLPIIIPQLTLEDANFSAPVMSSLSEDNTTKYVDFAVECSENYTQSLVKTVANCYDLETTDRCLADFFQGNGIFENTFLFYGNYTNKVTDGPVYPMSVVFITVVLAVLLVSLFLILYNLSGHRRSAVINTGGGAIDKFCNSVLTSWDFGLAERRAVKIKKSLIRQELRQLLTDKEVASQINARTTRQKIGLWVVRMIVNLIVIAVWGGSVYGIYRLQDVSNEKVKELNLKSEISVAEQLFYEYLSTGFITAIYLIVPFLFYAIVKLEDYRPNVEISITMIRIIFLRLLSLMSMLLTTLGKMLDEKTETSSNDCGRFTTSTQTSLNTCWETYLGQQIFKLVLLDFAVLLVITYLVEYPRQALYKRFEDTAFMKWLGQQEFDMPKNVMDVLYNQTLCWIGILFSPIIPLMIAVKMFLFFWIKKHSLFTNQKPSPTLAKSSAVYAFFLWIMLFSLIIAYFVVIIYMQSVTPSRSCGPFRVHMSNDSRMIDTLIFYVQTTLEPATAESAINVLTSNAFRIAMYLILTVLLVLLWYYFLTISHGFAAEAKIYVQQLARSVTDKQFILERVQNAIRETNKQSSAGIGAKSSRFLRDGIAAASTSVDNERNSNSNSIDNNSPPVRPAKAKRHDVNGNIPTSNGNIPTSNVNRESLTSQEDTTVVGTRKPQWEPRRIGDVRSHGKVNSSMSEDEDSERSRDSLVPKYLAVTQDNPRDASRRERAARRQTSTSDISDEEFEHRNDYVYNVKLLDDRRRRSLHDLDEMSAVHMHWEEHEKKLAGYGTSEPEFHERSRQKNKKMSGRRGVNGDRQKNAHNEIDYIAILPTRHQQQDYDRKHAVHPRSHGYDNETFIRDEDRDEHQELPRPIGIAKKGKHVEMERGQHSRYESVSREHEDKTSKRDRSRAQRGNQDPHFRNFRDDSYNNASLLHDERRDRHYKAPNSKGDYNNMGDDSRPTLPDESSDPETSGEEEYIHHSESSLHYRKGDRTDKAMIDHIRIVEEGTHSKNQQRRPVVSKSAAKHGRYSDDPTAVADGGRVFDDDVSFVEEGRRAKNQQRRPVVSKSAAKHGRYSDDPTAVADGGRAFDDDVSFVEEGRQAKNQQRRPVVSKSAAKHGGYSDDPTAVADGGRVFDEDVRFVEESKQAKNKNKRDAISKTTVKHEKYRDEPAAFADDGKVLNEDVRFVKESKRANNQQKRLVRKSAAKRERHNDELAIRTEGPGIPQKHDNHNQDTDYYREERQARAYNGEARSYSNESRRGDSDSREEHNRWDFGNTNQGYVADITERTKYSNPEAHFHRNISYDSDPEPDYY